MSNMTDICDVRTFVIHHLYFAFVDIVRDGSL